MYSSRPLDTMAELTIVIVSYNTRKELVACLTAIVDAPPATDHHIVVVDNGSEDESVETVRAQFPRVTVLENGTNLGYARANNIGVRSTDGELVLLLNSDTIVPSGAIDQLVARLRDADSTAVVGPRLTDAAGRPELSFGKMMSPFNELMQKLKTVALRSNLPLLSGWVRHSLTHPGTPDWVSGACLLVRRADADAVGLMDERFFLYGEDVDFCAAIRQGGAQVRFVPDVTVVHHRGRSGARLPQRTRQRYRSSQLAFYAKHHPRWEPVLRLYLRLKGELPPAGDRARRP